MKFSEFKLEEFFAKYEFSARYLLGCSDAETMTLSELLAFANEEIQELWNKCMLGYTEPKGLPLLRQEIAKLYNTVSGNDVRVFNGAEEAIFVIINALLNKGDQVVLFTPCYQSLKTLPLLCGAKVTEIQLNPENNWEIDLAEFENAICKNTKLIILNFPHNPTSYQPITAVFNKIIESAKQCGAYVLSDEVYRFSEHNEKDRLPAAVDCYEKAISIGVTSKTFGLAGLRIGWAVTKDLNILQKITSFKLYTTICSSATSELLTVIALRAKEKIIEKNLKIIKSNVDLLDQFFKKYADIFKWQKPKAGITAFPELKIKMSSDEFVERLVKAESVLLLPASVYDYPGKYFRIGFGRKNMPEALMKLETFITLRI